MLYEIMLNYFIILIHSCNIRKTMINSNGAMFNDIILNHYHI